MPSRKAKFFESNFLKSVLKGKTISENLTDDSAKRFAKIPLQDHQFFYAFFGKQFS